MISIGCQLTGTMENLRYGFGSNHYNNNKRELDISSANSYKNIYM